MNILILNWRDPKHPLAGGAEQMVYEHARYWKKQGEDVTWFASSFKKAKSEDNIDGIRIIRKGSHYTVFIWAFLFYLRGQFKEVTLVVDCFHFIPYFSRFYFKNTAKIAILQEVAGNLWYENLPILLAVIGKIAEPYILRSYRKIPFITGSDSAKKDLLQLGFNGRNVYVVNHGINRVKVKVIKKENNPVLIFLGRISKDKGIEDALMTLGLLTRDYADIKLWIVGKPESAEYQMKVKKLMKQFEVSKNCQWFGYVSEKEKFELLSRAWIMIHPSRKEGWGLNVIEANSVRTPVVGYAVSGLTDSIVDNKTGLLVDPDALSMADGVETLLKNKKLYKQFSDASEEWSKKFTWENSARKSYALISKIQR
ncbi:MAG: glycosyltransferase family 4 protein [Candidatus Levybacteria bacterium]|nr:glycosyltransferase family 4 protein [Candidatus Levybacteria bacterium]